MEMEELKAVQQKRDNCVKEVKEVWKSETDEATRVIKDFSGYTTLHGFHFVLDSASRIRRIIWITLISLGICALFFQFRDNWRKLRSYESVIGKDIEHDEKLLYPAITICNQNMMRKSKILGTDAQTFLDQQDHVKLHILGNKLLEEKTSPDFDPGEIVMKHGHNLSEMMKDCEWKNQPCTPANFSSFISFMVRFINFVISLLVYQFLPTEWFLSSESVDEVSLAFRISILKGNKFFLIEAHSRL